MSGIAGIIRFDGGPVELGMVAAMTRAMAHRGPDGIAHWQGEGVALGHCQMCTTPESLEETQPLTNEDASLVLVMDGRVDNWEELRQLLLDKGARLRTRADAELVLRAYEIWGKDCVEHIDGDFAFVIWDARERRAFCARDRTGAKPFVYHWDGKRLIFGSEIRAVRDAKGGPHSFNEGFLAETLAAVWFSRDETLWQGVSRLSASHTMIVEAGGQRIATYWHPERIPLLRYKSDKDYTEHYGEVFSDTVRRLSRAIGPAGYEVSGGLDSSAIFAAADCLHRDGRLPAPDIRAYTLQFEKGTGAYELDYAHAVGDHLGHSIEEVPPTIKPLDWFLEDSIEAATISNFPNGIMHLGEYERHRAVGGRVFLNGNFGDQWLNQGQHDLAEALGIGSWSGISASLRSDLAAYGGPRTAYRVLRHGLFPLLPAPVRDMVRAVVRRSGEGHEHGSSWLSPSLGALFKDRMKERVRFLKGRERRIRTGLRTRIWLLEEAHTTLLFEIIERMQSMAGIESRSPFLARAFIEMAWGLPLSQFRRGRVNRYVHRQAMRGLLPDVVRNRTTKAEMSVVYQPCIEDILKIQLNGEISASGWVNSLRFTRVQRDMLNPEVFTYDYLPARMLLCFCSCAAIFPAVKVD